jgi:hypothetical protein
LCHQKILALKLSTHSYAYFLVIGGWLAWEGNYLRFLNGSVSGFHKDYLCLGI